MISLSLSLFTGNRGELGHQFLNLVVYYHYSSILNKTWIPQTYHQTSKIRISKERLKMCCSFLWVCFKQNLPV